MTLTYGLIFMTGVLTGGGFGLFGSALHRERAAAEEHEAELEVAEFQELYETLATFHQDGPAYPAPAPRRKGL